VASADEDRPSAVANEEGFVRRWSKRKQAASSPATAPQPVAATEPAPPPVLTDADMPPVESLGENSDFSVFLSPGVSEGLRQLALRRMFRLASVNSICELESELYDFTDCVPLGDVVTHEMKSALEREAQRLRQQMQEAVLVDPESPADSDLPRAPETSSPESETGKA